MDRARPTRLIRFPLVGDEYQVRSRRVRQVMSELRRLGYEIEYWGVFERNPKINATNGAPAVRFVEGMPPNTATVDVRFKKGDDVWFLLPDPVSAAPIALEVPAVETDRFPDAEVDWVLVVFLDSDGQILDGVGALTP